MTSQPYGSGLYTSHHNALFPVSQPIHHPPTSRGFHNQDLPLKNIPGPYLKTLIRSLTLVNLHLSPFRTALQPNNASLPSIPCKSSLTTPGATASIRFQSRFTTSASSQMILSLFLYSGARTSSPGPALSMALCHFLSS